MAEQGNEIEFDTPADEEIDEYAAKEGRNRIFTDQGDPEIDSLYNK